MRLRSPAEFYLKGLVVDPRQFPTAELKERCLDEGVDFLSEAYLDRLRSKMKPPKPFHPDNPNHKASMRFVVQEGINRLFQRDVAMKMALEILEAPRAKEFVESMILVHVPLAAIAAFVFRQHSIYCTPAALEVYQHYFWNINLLDSTQMRVLLALRKDIAIENVAELKGRERILRNAFYRDARTLAADLPYSPTAAMLTQLRLGLMPARQDLAARLLEVQAMALARAAEAVHMDKPGDSKKFAEYSQGCRVLAELQEMTARPEDQMREQLASIALHNDTHILPSIHQLTDGQHTVELSPTKDDGPNGDEPPTESDGCELDGDAGAGGSDADPGDALYPGD